MPDKYKIIFNNKTVNARLHLRQGGYFELRATIDGKRYTGSGKTVEMAVEHFIANLWNEDENIVTKNITLEKYAELWLETVKRPKVKEYTYNNYENYFKNDILPYFGKKKVKDIRQFQLQSFINIFVDEGHDRVAQMIYMLLKEMFDYAVIDQIIDISPMAKIFKPIYEPKEKYILSKDEEKNILDGLKNKNNLYAQAMAFILYTGIRRVELKSAVINEDFVTVKCAKTKKNRKEKYRDIPITPMLRKVLPFIDLEAIKNISKDCLTRHIKDFCPNHTLHELRHTFTTRCQECGVSREMVSLWDGHVADSSVTSVVYTHFEQNKELQIKEAQKVDY